MVYGARGVNSSESVGKFIYGRKILGIKVAGGATLS